MKCIIIIIIIIIIIKNRLSKTQKHEIISFYGFEQRKESVTVHVCTGYDSPIAS